MGKNNLTVLFWLFKAKQTKSKKIPIYLRVSYAGQRRNVSTGFAISDNRWDSSRGLMRGKSAESTNINNYIVDTKAKLLESFREMSKTGSISLELLLRDHLNKDAQVTSITGLLTGHNEDIKKRIGVDYTYSTYEKYDILARKLANFVQDKYDVKDLPLSKLSIQFIEDFDFYLRNHDKNQHNTVTKYLKNLKKILTGAVDKGLLNSHPFKNFKTRYKDVDRLYLTIDELAKIEAKRFGNARLSIVKNLFLFQCYTGLSYSDMAKLKSDNILKGIDGKLWIFTRRKKTNVRVAIPLLDKANELLQLFSLYGTVGDLLLPVYSIQKFNTYLHEIADVCSINKKLTSHVGRRTFATTIALANGVSIETISKILGHTSTRITAQYAVVTDHKIAADMASLQLKLPNSLQEEDW